MSFTIELLPRVFLVFLRPCPPSWPTSQIRKMSAKRKSCSTDTTMARGSTSARCCILSIRSLNRFPSGCNVIFSGGIYGPFYLGLTFNALRLSVKSSPSCTSTSPSLTLCFPSLFPASPFVNFSTANRRRWASAACRSDRERSVVRRSDLMVSRDACIRFLDAFSANARF